MRTITEPTAQMRNPFIGPANFIIPQAGPSMQDAACRKAYSMNEVNSSTPANCSEAERIAALIYEHGECMRIKEEGAKVFNAYVNILQEKLKVDRLSFYAMPYAVSEAIGAVFEAGRMQGIREERRRRKHE